MTVAGTSAHRVVVLGGEGQLAQALRQVAWPAGFDAVYLGRSQCDITQRDAVEAVLDTSRPVAVINAAAYTQVDRAEAEEAKAAAINAAGPRILARSCQQRNISLLHVSTDYVFDGTQRTPYTEQSEPAPLNAYGRTKLAGDQAIMAATERHLIFRTSWVYSERVGSFVSKICELAQSRPELRVVADQTGCPTYAVDLAQALMAALPACVEDAPEARGLVNFAGTGETTWFDFAREIFVIGGKRLPQPLITPVTTAQYGAAAQRPAYSVLDCRQAATSLGLASRNWRDSLGDCLTKLLN
jgi:dTDP-4-dehydrorhamnose reductase